MPNPIPPISSTRAYTRLPQEILELIASELNRDEVNIDGNKASIAALNRVWSGWNGMVDRVLYRKLYLQHQLELLLEMNQSNFKLIKTVVVNTRGSSTAKLKQKSSFLKLDNLLLFLSQLESLESLSILSLQFTVPPDASEDSESYLNEILSISTLKHLKLDYDAISHDFVPTSSMTDLQTLYVPQSFLDESPIVLFESIGKTLKELTITDSTSRRLDQILPYMQVLHTLRIGYISRGDTTFLTELPSTLDRLELDSDTNLLNAFLVLKDQPTTYFPRHLVIRYISTYGKLEFPKLESLSVYTGTSQCSQALRTFADDEPSPFPILYLGKNLLKDSYILKRCDELAIQVRPAP